MSDSEKNRLPPAAGLAKESEIVLKVSADQLEESPPDSGSATGVETIVESKVSTAARTREEKEATSNEATLSKASIEEKAELLNSFPRLLPVQILLLFVSAVTGGFGLIAVPFYWLFCMARTTLILERMYGKYKLNSNIVMLLSSAPLLLVVLIPIIYLIAALSSFFLGPSLAGALFFLVILVVGVLAIAGCFAMQIAWPFTTSMLLSSAEGPQEIESLRKRCLKATGEVLLHNLTLPFIIVCVSFYYLLVYDSGYGAESVRASASWMRALMLLGSVSLPFLYFHYLKKRIPEVFAKTSEGKSIARKASKQNQISDDDIIIRYRSFAESERWIKQRFSQKSSKKLLFVIVTVVAFFALGAPQWGLDWIAKLAADAAASQNLDSQAMQTLEFTNKLVAVVFQFILAAGLFITAGAYAIKPSHLGISGKGIRFLWSQLGFTHAGRTLAWEDLERISILMPEGKTAPSDQILTFHSKQGRDQPVKLSSIIDVDDRERLLNAIQKWAPAVHRDAGVVKALEPPSDHSYTELWLQALSAPPKRERFKPLTRDARLCKGRFVVDEQLGVGGQGTAYSARDRDTDTTVVLKEFILPVYVDVGVRRQALERFENEARLLKAMDHEKIVKLRDFFIEDHRSYLVLEHIDGQSLKQLVDKEGALDEFRVLELCKQMCEILQYLHSLSPPVVHRDFTPDNLILRKDGSLTLVDFNVAQQTEWTTTGTVVGKHAYLPPEQFRGTPETRSDIYAMGATLHFLLTGEDPEPISISHPQKVEAEISDLLDHVVSTATAVDIDSRYKDAAEVLVDLDATGTTQESVQHE